MKINQLNTMTSPDVADGVAVGVGNATWRLSMAKLLAWIEANWGCDCAWVQYRSPDTDLVYVFLGEASYYGFTPPIVPGQDLMVLVEWNYPNTNITVLLPPDSELVDRQRLMLCPNEPFGCWFDVDFVSLGTYVDAIEEEASIISSPGVNAPYISTFHCPIYEYHKATRRWVNAGYGNWEVDP